MIPLLFICLLPHSKEELAKWKESGQKTIIGGTIGAAVLFLSILFTVVLNVYVLVKYSS